MPQGTLKGPLMHELQSHITRLDGYNKTITETDYWSLWLPSVIPLWNEWGGTFNLSPVAAGYERRAA